MTVYFKKTRITNKIALLIILCAGFGNGYAQSSAQFEHLTTENGLSQSDVNSIFQDKEGYMWFGTHDGLNRYDGYHFTVYKPNPKNPTSISSNLIWKIVDDEKGNLWIGTTGGGLNYFDKKTGKFTTFRHDDSDKNSIRNNYITVLFRDSTNKLWVGNSSTGIDMVDLNKPLDAIKFEHINFYSSGPNSLKNRYKVNTLFEDSMHQIWMGGIGNLSKLSKDKNGEFYFQHLNTSDKLPRVKIMSLAEDSFGNLMVGTTRGLYRYFTNAETNAVQKIYHGTVNVIIAQKDRIWAGSDDGFLEFSNTSNTAVPLLVNSYQYDSENPVNSITKNIVRSLCIDYTGIIWIGTNGGGVNKFDPQRKQFSHYKKSLNPESLSNNKVRAIYEDSFENLWIGTEGGGLNVSKNTLADKSFYRFENNTSIANVFAIEEIELKDSKKLLIGCENSPGLFEIELGTTKKITNDKLKPLRDVPNSVFAIAQDQTKNVWIGTYNGGVRRWLIKEDGVSFEKDIIRHQSENKHSISNNIIRDIHEDSKGAIWFATGDGLSQLSPDQKKAKKPMFNVYKNDPKDETTISNNYILAIFESAAGEIWIGTFGGGLNKLLPGSTENAVTFKTYSEEDGLPNNVIKGILEDGEGNLWLSTNKGLSKFNPRQETFQNYDVNDGLQSNEFSELTAFKMKDGKMLFGGVNGFNAFYPEDIINNTISPQTVVTNFSIFNKPVAIGEKVNGRVILKQSINSVKEIELEHSENSFSFEFAALHYAASKKNKYAHMLEGFNKEWVYTTSENRYATYTNLAPGSYTLKVKASNNDNLWDETPIELKINVIPPWWRTNLAKLFYLLFALGLLLAFRRYTIIRTKKKHQLDLDHLEKIKNEEIQRVKLEFFTNISHEFRTPLTLIKGPLDYLLKKGEFLSQKEVKDQYTLMRKNTDYLLRLVNQLLDFRKMDYGMMNLNLSKGNIVEFLQEVAEPFQFMSRKKNISFQVEASADRILTWFDPDAIEKIVNNLLSNAFKFTPENGEIILDVQDGASIDKIESLNLEIDQTKYIRIQVKDAGPGIPAHRLHHIFERFYTEMKMATHVNAKGTGIGLSFTKNLVELHQGIINVKSDAENGTTFFVWLPKEKEDFIEKTSLNFNESFEPSAMVVQEEADFNAVSFIDDIVDNNIVRSRSKLPVLLVIDDNPDIRTFIKTRLGEDYYIYEAENGEKGFELAIKFMPNIVITDLVMPVMDGIAFSNKLKSTKETSHIPIVMLTAKISQEKEIEGLKTGIDAYIRKPFDMELLEIKLSNILKHRGELRKRFNREITLQPKDVTVTSSDEAFLQNAIDVVEKNMMNSEFSVEMLVKEMMISRSNLYLKIKELTGLSSSEFIRNIRLKRAVQLFDKSDLSIKEIMYRTGFNTASYFSKCFKKQFGVIPSKYVSANASNKKPDE